MASGQESPLKIHCTMKMVKGKAHLTGQSQRAIGRRTSHTSGVQRRNAPVSVANLAATNGILAFSASLSCFKPAPALFKSTYAQPTARNHIRKPKLALLYIGGKYFRDEPKPGSRPI